MFEHFSSKIWRKTWSNKAKPKWKSRRNALPWRRTPTAPDRAPLAGPGRRGVRSPTCARWDCPTPHHHPGPIPLRHMPRAHEPCRADQRRPANRAAAVRRRTSPPPLCPCRDHIVELMCANHVSTRPPTKVRRVSSSREPERRRPRHWRPRDELPLTASIVTPRALYLLPPAPLELPRLLVAQAMPPLRWEATGSASHRSSTTSSLPRLRLQSNPWWALDSSLPLPRPTPATGSPEFRLRHRPWPNGHNERPWFFLGCYIQTEGIFVKGKL
jgi:hypothetical protein